MKTIAWGCFVLFCLAADAVAQTADTQTPLGWASSSEQGVFTNTPPTILASDPPPIRFVATNVPLAEVPDELDTQQVIADAGLTNSPVLIGTPPKKRIRPTAEGAIADFGLLTVQFASDAAAQRPILITTPDGRTLACRATFLALHDTRADESLILGEVKSSLGCITSPTEVTYTNAFDTIKAHLRYHYDGKLNSLAQDIILEESIELPPSFDATSTKLEVWTAWLDSVPDSIEQQLVPEGEAGVSPTINEVVNFGSAKIVPEGKAFSLQEPEDQVRVVKQWVQAGNASENSAGTYLIESIDFSLLKSKLDRLGGKARQSSYSTPKSSRSELLKALSLAPRSAKDPQSMLLAQGPTINKNAVVLDFIIISSVPVPWGAVSWWPAGGNGNDAVGTNHASAAGSIGYVSGKVGEAVKVNAVNSGLGLGNPANLQLQNFTIEAWIKRGDSTYASWESSYNNAPIFACAWGGYGLGIMDDGRIFLTKIGSSAVFSTWSIGGDTNSFHHVAVTKNGTNVNFYVDGHAETAASYNPGFVFNGPLAIGARGMDYAGAFRGAIDEVTVYSRALSGAEVGGIYTAGAAGKYNSHCQGCPANAVAWWPGDGALYDFARTNGATVVGGVTYASGKVGPAFAFSGSGQNLEVPDCPALNPTSALTLETWVYVTANANTHRDILSKDGEYSARQYLLTVSSANRFRPHVWTASEMRSFEGNTPVLLNTWYHVAMTYDRTVLRLYVNGQLDRSVSYAAESTVTTTQPVRIGGGAPSWPEYYFPGLIDEPAIYDRVLSDSEISAIYAAGCAGKCKVDSDSDGLTDLQESYLGTQAGDSDTDNDGVTDGDEVFVYGTNPLLADTDGDGLPDNWETAKGTKVLVNDAAEDPDGDGLTNLWEFLRGTEPKQATPVLIQVTQPKAGAVIH